MNLQARINQLLDRFVRPDIVVLNGPRAAFKLCGGAGMACALGLGTWLAARGGLRLWVVAAVALSSVFSFFALAFATKIVAGAERLVYYHQQTGVLATAACALWALGQPALPYLDLVAVGVGAFLCCGRVGCLMVGCCYGRPHRWGVRYGAEHAAEGFPDCYVGARLFPVQAFEAVWTLAVVAACCLAVVGGRPAGSALSLYFVAYAAGRFYMEFARGDAERPYLRGFSEAQWTSLVLTTAVAAAEASGLLPPNRWHLAAPACLAASMLSVAAYRSRDGAWRHRLLHPRHVRELAETMRALTRGEAGARDGGVARGGVVAQGGEPVRVECTSLGVLISRGGEGAGGADHYALSRRNGRMDEETARSLAELICGLRGRPAAGALLLGRRAIFHLILPADSQTTS